MAGRTIDICDMAIPDRLASKISNQFMEWEIFRNNWLTQKQEIRDYIFATDTRSTSTAHLPWKNSVHLPKLCQIRDNLHANYMAAIFPNDRPVEWEGDDQDSNAKQTRLVIEAYMENKMRMSKFRTEVSKTLYDFIDYGNCFGFTEFVAEASTDSQTGEKIPGYVGPRLQRISPTDLVFNPVASSFEESPKIIRTLKTYGTLKADMQDHPEMGYLAEAFEKHMDLRGRFLSMSQGDQLKTRGFQVDGFSSLQHYYQSDYVELLDFYGDIYDVETGEFLKNQVVTVLDRHYIIRQQTNPSWFGKASIFHCGWRLRPDNLYAMGPLDNLVGMQYRINHIENAKADSHDMIVVPMTKIKGFVEDFDYEPGGRIYLGDDGDAQFMQGDWQHIIQADSQVERYEAKMEEMAGAPKQAMGFRTPGEKTAYEVQILENGSNRIFLNKTSYYEEEFMEPVLNSMLEIGRRNMGPSDIIRVVDDQYGVADFMKITREDIAARGKIRPIGARHFARNANIVQNLTQLASSAIGQDPAVTAHISGKKLAALMEQLLNLERFDLVQDNVRIAEQLETQKLAQAGQQILGEQNMQQTGQPSVPADPGGASANPLVQQPPKK